MMSHFPCDKDAIVTEYSHNTCQRGNDWEHEYEVYIKGEGEVAWYSNSTLTLIKHNQMALIKKWKAKEKVERKEKSDLDWIFENGKDVLKDTHGSTVKALAKCLGCRNLWGSSGEGYVYLHNAVATMTMAKEYLETNDKEGWLKFAKAYRAERRKERRKAKRVSK